MYRYDSYLYNNIMHEHVDAVDARTLFTHMLSVLHAPTLR